MAEIIQAAAVVLAGMFAGGASMQSLVDHPARVAMSGVGSVDQMQRSLGRADPYMPTLAALSAATSLAGYFVLHRPLDLAAALLFMLVGVVTFTFIIPMNKKILATRLVERDVPPALTLMRRWSKFHALRSLTGLTAFLLLVIAATSQPLAS